VEQLFTAEVVVVSADAYHITAPHPDGLGASVMLNCLRDAGLKQMLTACNMHGTSTPLGDLAESKQSLMFWRACI
jgi:3-oxoacyl-[acyl-carrier-protein] synthase II